MPRVSVAHEQEVRARIVAAAMEEFAEKGLHRATMQDVVRRSGLSVGAIYTYFSGKAELFLAGCGATTDIAMDELARQVSRATTTAERLAIAVAFFVESIDGSADRVGMAPLLVQAWAEADAEPAIRETLVRRRERIVTAGRLFLQDGIARGELAAWLDVEGLATAYSALLDGLILQRIEEGARWRRSEAERRARIVLELVLAAGPERPAVPVVPAGARPGPTAVRQPAVHRGR